MNVQWFVFSCVSLKSCLKRRTLCCPGRQSCLSTGGPCVRRVSSGWTGASMWGATPRLRIEAWASTCPPTPPPTLLPAPPWATTRSTALRPTLRGRSPPGPGPPSPSATPASRTWSWASPSSFLLCTPRGPQPPSPSPSPWLDSPYLSSSPSPSHSSSLSPFPASSPISTSPLPPMPTSPYPQYSAYSQEVCPSPPSNPSPYQDMFPAPYSHYDGWDPQGRVMGMGPWGREGCQDPRLPPGV